MANRNRSGVASCDKHARTSEGLPQLAYSARAGGDVEVYGAAMPDPRYRQARGEGKSLAASAGREDRRWSESGVGPAGGDDRPRGCWAANGNGLIDSLLSLCFSLAQAH